MGKVKESGDGGSGDRLGGEAGDAGYRAESGDATKETHSRGRVRGGDTGAEEVVVERLGRDGEDGEALAARNRAEALYLQLYGDVVGAEGSMAGSSASRSASPASGAMRFGEVRTKAHRHKCECEIGVGTHFSDHTGAGAERGRKLCRLSCR